MGLLKGQFDSSHTVSDVLKHVVLDGAHPNTSPNAHSHSLAGVTDQSILKMTYVSVH